MLRRQFRSLKHGFYVVQLFGTRSEPISRPVRARPTRPRNAVKDALSAGFWIVKARIRKPMLARGLHLVGLLYLLRLHTADRLMTAHLRQADSLQK